MSIQELLSDERTSQQAKRIYDDHKFPFEVRYHLDDFLVNIAWKELLSGTPVDRASHARTLLEEVLQKITDIMDQGSLSDLEKINLRCAHSKLQSDFQIEPVKFLQLMRDCFDQEAILKHTHHRPGDKSSVDYDQELLIYKRMEEKVLDQEETMKMNDQIVQSMIEEFHSTVDEYVPKISDTNEQMLITNQKQNESMDLIEKDKCTAQIYKYKKEIKQIAVEITTRKVRLYDAMVVLCKSVKYLMEICWSGIKRYKQQQKQSVCFLGKTPEGAVETLNIMCEHSGKYLFRYIKSLESVLADIRRIKMEQDEQLVQFEKILADMNKMLEYHLQSILLVTRQPHNVVKIVSNKSPQLNMSVTLLGGVSLGIHLALPTVNIGVYHENMLEKAIDSRAPIKGVCDKIDNGAGVRMVVKSLSNHIQAELNHVVLRGVSRLEKKDKVERVTEYKYGVIFYTEVVVNSMNYALKVLSLPIVLTSQTSQEGASKGILVWDAAFSELDRSLYQDPTEGEWSRMRQVLVGMFEETSRELEDPQLDYIKRYILGNGFASEQPDNAMLTRKRLLRDKVPRCDFTYWMWLSGCKNLITDYVKNEWTDSIIYGFISREEAEGLLRDADLGTFILRFRERKLQDSQRAQRCAYLAVAVVVPDGSGNTKVEHLKDFLTPVDIHKYGLPKILKSMVDSKSHEKLLTTIYPDRNFLEVIEHHLHAGSGSCSGSGYFAKSDLVIAVRSSNKKQDSNDDPRSPLSVATPHTPRSPYSPSPSCSSQISYAPSPSPAQAPLTPCPSQAPLTPGSPIQTPPTPCSPTQATMTPSSPAQATMTPSSPAQATMTPSSPAQATMTSSSPAQAPLTPYTYSQAPLTQCAPTQSPITHYTLSQAQLTPSQTLFYTEASDVCEDMLMIHESQLPENLMSVLNFDERELFDLLPDTTSQDVVVTDSMLPSVFDPRTGHAGQSTGIPMTAGISMTTGIPMTTSIPMTVEEFVEKVPGNEAPKPKRRSLRKNKQKNQ